MAKSGISNTDTSMRESILRTFFLLCFSPIATRPKRIQVKDGIYLDKESGAGIVVY
jgi:hypothetical protein